MVMLVGGIADGRNIEVHMVNGQPIEEVRFAHIAQPPVEWRPEYADRAPTPSIRADVYRFDGVQYRYDRTVGV